MLGGAPLQIDRLRLELPAGSVADARKLGALVAARLAEAGGLPETGDLPVLSVAVQADLTTGDLDRVAQEISLQILRALSRRR